MMRMAPGRSSLEQNGSLTFQVFSLQEENQYISENLPPPPNKYTSGRAAAVTSSVLGFPTVTEKGEENCGEGKQEKIWQGLASQGHSKVAEVIQVGQRKKKWSNPN